jgi:hypothetical protein
MTPAMHNSAIAFFTINGQRNAMEMIPQGHYPSLAALILRLCGLDDSADAQKQPQSGAMAATLDGHRVTLPVQMTPSADGSTFHIDLPATEPGIVAAIKRKLHRPTVLMLEPSTDGLMDILRSQTAAGALEHQSIGSFAFRLEVQNELAVLASGREVSGESVTTALNLLSLQMCHGPRRELWQRAHAKGCRFVADAVGVTPEDVVRMLDGLQRRFAATPAASATTATTTSTSTQSPT